MRIEARRIGTMRTPNVLGWIIGVIIALTSLGIYEGGGALP